MAEPRGSNLTYDIIAKAVRNFWKETMPQPVVVYFFQKYGYSDIWEDCATLATCEASDDYETVEFLHDFCEGQQDARGITIVPLHQVLDYYKNNKL